MPKRSRLCAEEQRPTKQAPIEWPAVTYEFINGDGVSFHRLLPEVKDMRDLINA